jgi:mono/diheme cytochrome c family protein
MRTTTPRGRQWGLAAWWAAALAAFLLAEAGAKAAPFAQQDELPPGWALQIVRSASGTVTTHAEHAAFTLNAGESLHPECMADDCTGSFVGEIRVVRDGRYRFGLDHELASASMSVQPAGAVTEGAWIDLAAGWHLAEIHFARKSGRARLRVWWEMQDQPDQAGFAPEPIPSRLVRVPADFADAVRQGLSERRGRVQLTELGCVACHDAGERGGVAAPRREPIRLDRVAARASRDWLRKWIVAPQGMNPGCGMPSLFDPEQKKPGDRADVDALLALFDSLADEAAAAGAPPTADLAVDPSLATRGRELFHETGCVGCHGPLEPPSAVFGDDAMAKALAPFDAPVPYGDLTNKWRLGELAAFLRDPKSVRLHGRMPSLGLDENEAMAIAHYLGSRFGVAPPAPTVTTLPAETPAAPTQQAPAASGAPAVAARPKIDPAVAAAGKKVFVDRGCSECHSLGGPIEGPSTYSKPLAQLDLQRGCLADATAARGTAPRYDLAAPMRADLRAGIESVKRASGLVTPLDATQRTLAAFRCTACHERDQRGGVREPLLPFFKSRAEADLGDEGRLPPRLDGVGQRLQSPWLQKVVAEGVRARPYLWARMPAFGTDIGASTASGLAAIEGEWRSDDPAASAAPIAATEELAVAGRKLAGSGGLTCITCHSFGTRPSAGTPGLDFTQFSTRLRAEWWRRYARSPLRFKPGTRMPTFFENGKSAAVSIFDGDATRQIDALWAWFEKSSTMPAPEGVPTGEKMVLDVGDRPKVFRTFLERAGNRGIAVGYPAGLHFAFDAEQIRLCEAWSGEFLDVAPVWTGRGGNVAPQLGPIVWSAPAGPALMLEKPEGEWPTDSGRKHGLKFGGYRLEPDGTPVFLWDLRKPELAADEPSPPDAVHVEETFVPDPSPDVLFVRTLTITNLADGVSLYFHAPARSDGTQPFAFTAHDINRFSFSGSPGDAGGVKVQLVGATEPLKIRIEVKP